MYMCGIIGVKSVDSVIAGFVMKELLLQSQIRGKHATGISYVHKGKIKTISKPIPAKEFITQEMPEFTTAIGHVRYSTSDIRFNQPIADDTLSIVHNGIVTQESFEHWLEHFAYKNFETNNDSEFIFKSVQSLGEPFYDFIDASIAYGALHWDGTLTCARNYTRPLWLFQTPYVSGFASTKDIITRTFNNLNIDVPVVAKALPFVRYEIMEADDIADTPVNNVEHRIFKTDQQISTQIENKYL